MKNTVKETAKKATLATINIIATPLHMTAQLASNVAQLTADGIAMGEGYLTEKVDSTQHREDIANKRVEYTQAKFLQTAMKLEQWKNKTKKAMQEADAKMENIKQKLTKANDIEVHTAEIVPAAHYNYKPGAAM